MVQRVFFTCNHLWHFCNIDLKLNGFDIIQTKKAEKSSCFLQFTQCVFNLENYKDSLRRCWGYHYCLFLKILFFFMWCNLTAENKKNSSVHWHKGFVNYIFFPFRHQSTLRLFLLSPLAKIQFICFMYSFVDFVTMDNVERDINSFWEDDINPFTRKNETKCVKIIPRFSIYLPIHN